MSRSSLQRFAVIFLSVYISLMSLQQAAFLLSASPSGWNQDNHASDTIQNLLRNWGNHEMTTKKVRHGGFRFEPYNALMKSSIFTTKPANNSNFQRNTNKSLSFYNCSIHEHNYSLPQVPQFIIVGAQKSGTTALYELLKEHPQVQGSSVAETHFFDWHYPKDKEERVDFLKKYHQLSVDNLTPDEWQCALRKTYSDFFVSTSSDNNVPRDTVFVEKTPSYLFLAETPERILETCFWKPKVIVLLRNPIDRALSHYRMNILVKGRTFESLLDEEVSSLHTIGLSRAPPRKEFNATTLHHPGFSDLPVLTKEEQKKLHWKHYRKTFTTNYLQRGMYIVQLEHWLEHFPLKESLHVIQHERFVSDPRSVYQEVLKFMDLPTFDPPSNYETEHNVARYRLKRPLSQHTRSYLEAFFQPYNRLLAKRLGPEWQRIWEFEVGGGD